MTLLPDLARDNRTNLVHRYPKAPLIKRQGEVDAWDNADFRAAIKAAKKSQIIIAGIVTDVCTYYLP